jgi:hypothetical protein
VGSTSTQLTIINVKNCASQPTFALQSKKTHMNLHKSIILTLAKITICSLEGSLAKSYKMLSNIVTPLINIIKFQILNLPTFATMLHTLVKLGHTYFRKDMCNCMTTIHWVLYHLNYLALPKRQKL